MDTVGSAAVASALGTTVARVDRAARAGLEGATRDARGRWRFTPEAQAELRRRWGSVPKVVGRSRSEILLLAALARRPRGLASARAAAAVTGLAPTTAAKVLSQLEGEGLIESVAEVRGRRGRATRVTVWRARLLVPGFDALRGALRAVTFPDAVGPDPAQVPPRAWQLFWQGDPRALDARSDGAHIARRVLTARDPEAEAWAAAALRPEHWEAAATMRGLDELARRTARARAAR